MAGRRSWDEVGGVALEIIRGEHDANLSYIQQACGQRIKRMFRKSQRVRLNNTGNVTLDGMEGTIEKVNTKSISVVLDDGRSYNVAPQLLELVPLTSSVKTQ